MYVAGRHSLEMLTEDSIVLALLEHILKKHSSSNGISKAKATLKIHLNFLKLKRFIEI